MKSLKLLTDFNLEEELLFNKIVQDFINQQPETYFQTYRFSNEFSRDREELLEVLKTEEIDFLRIRPEELDVLEDYLIDLTNIIQDLDIQFVNNSSNNKFFALPDTIDGLLLFANNKILRQYEISMPSTWDEFREALRIIKSKNQEIIPFALHNLKDFKGGWAYYLFQFFLSQTDIEFTTLELLNLEKTPQYKETIKFLNELVDEGLLGILDQDEYESRGSIAFAREKAAFIVEGPWALSTIEQNNKELLNYIDFAVLKKDKQRTLLGGRYFAISKKGKNYKLALEFIKYLITSNKYYPNLFTQNKISGLILKTKSDNICLNKIQEMYSKYGEKEVILTDHSKITNALGNLIGKSLL